MDAIDNIDQTKYVVRASAKTGLEPQASIKTSNMIYKRRTHTRNSLHQDFNYEAAPKP